ncbi:MAG: glycosyltransferase [Candidatus Cloacimonadales bacterium]|nr:glycosyltransferase [Candidatus Cloacimonadota bacterium]MDD2650344.1 glycosyltransferase [Candidatus Cloacimonadota bacterium]MDX9976917.1 glycosyltransferase [Candidatus Cloacimonadales bacterium]
MKKVLIITYYWPPCGGAGVQRWLKISKHLSQFGWLPTIITTENGDYPFYDSSLLREVPKEMNVVRTKTPSFKNILSIFGYKEKQLPYGSLETKTNDAFSKRLIYYIRAQFVAPDARVIWNRYGLREAEKLIKENDFQAVITTGPPHSSHLIGLNLNKKYGITWLVDLRDPWTNIYYYQSAKRNFVIKAIDRYFENKVITKADAVITVSEHIAKSLKRRDIKVIHNAFDSIDYLPYNYKASNIFRIKFVGNLNASRKDEIIRFIMKLDKLCVIDNLNIEFSVIGEQEDFAKDLFTERIVIRNTGFLSHKNVIEECVNSELLLLLINRAEVNKGILTFKLFEYLGSQTKILGLGPTDGDAAKILRESNTGIMYDYHDLDGYTKYIKGVYESWTGNKLERNIQDLNKYSVSFTTEMIVKVLQSLSLS